MKFKNLHKEKWGKVKLGDICEKVQKTSPKRNNKDEFFNYIEIGAINSKKNRVENIRYLTWGEASPNAQQIVYKNDILVSRVRVNLKKIGIITQNVEKLIATVGFVVLRVNKKIANPLYVFYECLSDKIYDRLVKLQTGTTYPCINNSVLFNQKIHLPPLPEQKLISSILYKIEETIEQTEKQEKALVKYKKNLLNSLFCENGSLGNLVDLKNCKKVKIGELAKEFSERAKKENFSEQTVFVGLKNFESGAFFIAKYSNPEKLISAMKVMKEGDLLIARRNAHLKRASITKHNGICSGDAIIVQAKKNKTTNAFLVLFMNSEYFWTHSIANAAGSISKRVKWSAISNLKIYLPDFVTQQKIVEIFFKIENTIEQTRSHKEKLVAFKKGLLNELIG